jgi:hypothetical protein
MNTMELFNLAQLSEATYGYFTKKDGTLITTDKDVENILQGLKPDGSSDPKSSLSLSETQAKMFVEKWSVVAHQANTETGFSATLFKNKQTGELVYAPRGTEGSNLTSPEAWDDLARVDLGDLVADGLAFTQIIDMYNERHA